MDRLECPHTGSCLYLLLFLAHLLKYFFSFLFFFKRYHFSTFRPLLVYTPSPQPPNFSPPSVLLPLSSVRRPCLFLIYTLLLFYRPRTHRRPPNILLSIHPQRFHLRPRLSLCSGLSLFVFHRSVKR